ncbi:MAG: serine hydrolase domain-containing protein [Pirellulaceae bacterium]
MDFNVLSQKGSTVQANQRPSRVFDRRTFIGQSGMFAIGAGLAFGLSRLESNEPADAGIDDTKLQAVIDFLERECSAGSFPGAAIVASQHGKIFLEHYTGTYHNMLGEDKPYRRDVRSLFYSYSKGISATVVMMAHQEELIDIDATVASYIPEFAANGKDKITLRHVLTHSAGIPSAPTPFKPLRNEEEWEAAVDAVCHAKLEWEPGSQTGYHGLAMMIPAEIVRRMSGRRTWNTICQERLFDPIDAKSLTFDVPEDHSLVNIAPGGSTGQDGMQSLLAGHPAGGCFGTLTDGLRVLQLHLNRGAWEGRTLLHPEALDAMHTVQYANEITAASSKGIPAKHDNWAVGWLLRGEGTAQGGSGWFGFKDQTNPQIFGHAGIDTVIGVADPATGVALMFNTTRSPKNSDETVRLRNETTNRIFAAVNS